MYQKDVLIHGEKYEKQSLPRVLCHIYTQATVQHSYFSAFSPAGEHALLIKLVDLRSEIRVLLFLVIGVIP